MVNFMHIKKIKKIIKRTIKTNDTNKRKLFKIILSVLGGTVGAGNVVGIATAITMGGPSAIFCMLIIALFSMVTNMVEVSLAVKHHKKIQKVTFMVVQCFI